MNNGLHPQKSGGEEPLTHLPSLLKLQRPFSLQGLLCPVHTLFYSTTFMSHDSQAPSHDLSFHSFPFSNLLPAPDHGSGHFNIITSSHAKQGGYCSSSRLTWASLTRPSPNENMGCCVSSRLIWACLTGPNPIKLYKKFEIGFFVADVRGDGVLDWDLEFNSPYDFNCNPGSEGKMGNAIHEIS